MKDLNFATIQQSNKFGGLNHVLSKKGVDETKLLAESSNQADTVTTDEQELAVKKFIYVAPITEKEPKTV